MATCVTNALFILQHQVLTGVTVASPIVQVESTTTIKTIILVITLQTADTAFHTLTQGGVEVVTGSVGPAVDEHFLGFGSRNQVLLVLAQLVVVSVLVQHL